MYQIDTSKEYSVLGIEQISHADFPQKFNFLGTFIRLVI